MDALVTPYGAALDEAVEAVYAVFGAGHVSTALETCACPVCMTEHTRQQIIATPTRLLSEGLIAAYSNSAHGVPDNLDDLRLMLPRYLELIAQDQMVDHVGVGTELLRFGDAVRRDPAVYTSAQWAALNTWARLVILHFAHAEAREDDNLHSPYGLFDTLLCGGWDVDVITAAFDEAFAAPQTGALTLLQFCRMMARHLLHKAEGVGVDWFGVRYVSPKVRAGVADWLNRPRFANAVLALSDIPDLSVKNRAAVLNIAAHYGTFHGNAFPVATHRKAPSSV